MASKIGARVVVGTGIVAVLVVGFLIKRYLSGKKKSKEKPKRSEGQEISVTKTAVSETLISEVPVDEHERDIHTVQGVRVNSVKGAPSVEEEGRIEKESSSVVHELFIPKSNCVRDKEEFNGDHRQTDEITENAVDHTEEQIILRTENKQLTKQRNSHNTSDVDTEVKSKVNEFVKSVITESVKKVNEGEVKTDRSDSGIFIPSLSSSSCTTSDSGSHDTNISSDKNSDKSNSNVRNTSTVVTFNGQLDLLPQNDTDINDLALEDDSGRFSREEITDALLVSQNSPGLVSTKNAEVLVSLLGHPDQTLVLSAVNGIIKCSAFHRNQNLLREHGCLTRLGKLLRRETMSLRSGLQPSQKFVSSVTTAISNLSVNTENSKQLEACVPTLVDLTLEDETGESVCLSSLQALTNLSVTSHHHGHYTRVVQRLYDLLNSEAKSIKLQSLKVLVNLSCNLDMVPHLLAAKAPDCVYEFLKPGTDEAILLRWTTVLANILHTVKEKNLSPSSLPCDDKAPSPETMYSALLSMNSLSQIKSKVFLLCRHRNQDIQQQATKIHHSISR